ncbi:UNVERIFIED_CONTAM: hypothetical protein FKN15_048284 [Acipenser sinensis]
MGQQNCKHHMIIIAQLHYWKRVRQETPKEEEFEKVLHTAEHALKMQQSLLQQTPAPNWMAARLRGLVTHPYRKRVRQETPKEEEFEKVLHTAEHALKMQQ